MELVFEWNREKERINFQKHGITFNEAKSVFYDPLARIFDDVIHSVDESREIIIGHSFTKKLLLVVYVERKQNQIRIISARQATKKEKKNYEENKNKY
ncbi:MAG: BrnT family toxin [Ignavibacteriales bacterium]|nr:MAG: BrnT family toxin [Ignavibacteriales bacterium]